MATRLYFDIDTAGAVSPSSWSSGWNTTGSGEGTLRPNNALGFGSSSSSTTLDGTAGNFTASRRFVSLPLKAQTISGTLKGQIRAQEGNALFDVTVAVAAKVIKSDGTDRGILLAVSASDDLTHEVTVGATVTNRKFRDAAESASLSLSSLAVSDGDRLVVELGFRQAAITVAASVALAYQLVANDTDLPEDDTSTATDNPWVEFSGALTFLQPWYHGSASNPADNGTAQEPITLAVTPPASMIAGDLVQLIGQIQAADATLITLSEQGGQTWTGPSSVAANDQGLRLWWCVFDGTWDANPSLAFGAVGGNQSTTAIMHVFRGDPTRTWTEDTAFSGGAEASADPVVISGITPANDSNVTLAGVAIPNNSDWGVSGAGWEQTGLGQYRNLAGSDQSSAFAHQVQHTKAATGDVSQNPSTAAAGISFTQAWYLLSNNKELVADAGSHVITGTAATPEHDKQVVADAGSYAITGSDVTLNKGLTLAVDAGSHVITGSTAALEHDKQVVADAGSYAVTGEAAALNKGLTLSVDAGSHVVTGSDATFEQDRQIIADAGSHVITGSAAALEHDKQIRAPDGRWVASNVNASVVLSLGDLKATFGGASPVYRSGAAAFSLSSGKHYWEVTADLPGPVNNDRAVGLAASSDLTALVNNGNWLGINVPEVAVYENSETWVNGNFTASIGKSFGAGSVVRIAFDATAGKLWAGDSVGWWTGDPATDTSPLISGIASDIWFPAFTLRATGDSFTANFGATAFAHAVPSGFTAADAAAAGGYVIAGTTAALEHDRQIIADAGSHIIIGADATLTVGQTLILDADAGSHTITGSDATFIHSIILEADAGSYAVAGSDADLTVTAVGGQPSVTPTGGWPDLHDETPQQRAARIRRERQRLGIIPPDPEPVEIAGEATYIGPAEARDEQPLPGETKPAPEERDFTDLIAGTAMAKAMRDAEDEAIAILLLMA